MFRDTFDVRGLESRGVILAAIGALKTVNTLECFFMEFRKLVQHVVADGGFLRFFQEAFVLLLPVL